MKHFTYLSILAGVVMFFSAGTLFAATDDYTHRYTFDEGTGRTVLDSAGGQNGGLTGTSTGFGWASGMMGTALSMDGVQGESVVLPDGFIKGSQGSIALWFKVNNLSDHNTIFSARSASDSYIYATLVVDHEGRPEFLFRTTVDGNDRKAQGTKILNKNEWYQLVFTGDSQTYRMYVNGEKVPVAGDNIGKWFSDLTPRTFTYRIGSLDAIPLSGVFDGYLDDMRIYDRVLSQEDVTALYNGGKPGTPGLPLSAQSIPVTTVNLVATTTTPQLTSTSTSVVAQVLSAPSAPVTQTLVSTNTEATRKAQIQALINQILALIAELQKQLAVLKGEGAPTTGGHY